MIARRHRILFPSIHCFVLRSLVDIMSTFHCQHIHIQIKYRHVYTFFIACLTLSSVKDLSITLRVTAVWSFGWGALPLFIFWSWIVLQSRFCQLSAKKCACQHCTNVLLVFYIHSKLIMLPLWNTFVSDIPFKLAVPYFEVLIEAATANWINIACTTTVIFLCTVEQNGYSSCYVAFSEIIVLRHLLCNDLSGSITLNIGWVIQSRVRFFHHSLENCVAGMNIEHWDKSLCLYPWWPPWWAQQRYGSPPPTDESRWTALWQNPPWTHGCPRPALCLCAGQMRGHSPGEENFFLGRSGPVYREKKGREECGLEKG